ncbi:PH domain-containing protein [Halobium salinum]|uniref:PH domain-containing protein n=1 Tax=Halobium salinum TaxID=1364940 RepID=A0ABD5P843_9EURY|nr:PH domain-containing protein [Halobium salinum]
MNRLHPRVQVLWAVRAALLAVVLGAITWVVSRVALDLPTLLPVGVFLVALVVGVAYAAVKYRLWGYEVREDSLYLERGVFTRVRTVVPFVRIQHVDSARGPAERFLGLASTVVYTAGSRGADVSIPGLTPDGADSLQDRLKRLAIRAEGEDAV